MRCRTGSRCPTTSSAGRGDNGFLHSSTMQQQLEPDLGRADRVGRGPARARPRRCPDHGRPAVVRPSGTATTTTVTATSTSQDSYIDHFRIVHAGEGEPRAKQQPYQGEDGDLEPPLVRAVGASTNQVGGTQISTRIGGNYRAPENGGVSVFGARVRLDSDHYDTRAGQRRELVEPDGAEPRVGRAYRYPSGRPRGVGQAPAPAGSTTRSCPPDAGPRTLQLGPHGSDGREREHRPQKEVVSNSYRRRRGRSRGGAAQTSRHAPAGTSPCPPGLHP